MFIVYLTVPINDDCSIFDAYGICKNGGSCTLGGDSKPMCRFVHIIISKINAA